MLLAVLREVFYEGLDAQGWARVLAAFQQTRDGESLEVGERYLEEHLQRAARAQAQALPWGLWRLTSLRRDERFEADSGVSHDDLWESSAVWEERHALRRCLLCLSPERRFRDDTLQTQWLASTWADREGQPHSRDPDAQRYFQGPFYTREMDRQEAPQVDQEGFLPVDAALVAGESGEGLLYTRRDRRGMAVEDRVRWSPQGLWRGRRLRARSSQILYTASYERVCPLER
jgi:hypothetical protein